MVSAPSVKGLICPNCGAAITLRTGAQAQTVVCDNCHAVLDAKDPNLKILQKFDEKMTWRPEIPLGTRGTLKGDQYEAIGFQVRAIREEGRARVEAHEAVEEDGHDAEEGAGEAGAGPSPERSP